MQENGLTKKVLAAAHTHGLFKVGERGLVCVSGGGDSMAALYLLREIAGALPLDLEVVHFDHGLRPESGREARWVEQQTAGLGLPFHLRAATELKTLTAGVPAAARAWRTAETAGLLRNRNAAWAATGHQRDDNTETVLLKLLRGCHLSHLRGMEWRAGPFIRPLLGIPRQELRTYLEQQGVKWLEDPSNQDPHYKRNRLRHELIPLMNALAGGKLEQRLENLARQAAQLEQLLAAHPPPPQNHPAQPPHWMEAGGLALLPAFARSEALHRFIQERLPGGVASEQIGQALALLAREKPVWQIDLPGRRLLKRVAARLILEHHPRKTPPPQVQEMGSWRVEAAPHLEVTMHEGACGQGMKLHNLPPGGNLCIRGRLPGDRFHPPWRERPVKLKDFLRDQHIPLFQRDQCPLVVWENQVIAVYPDFPALGFASQEPEGSMFCFHVKTH